MDGSCGRRAGGGVGGGPVPLKKRLLSIQGRLREAGGELRELN